MGVCPVQRAEKIVGERLNKVTDEFERRLQTLKQSLHQEAQQATLGVERLQKQFNAKVEKDTQVVGALSDQCGTLSCLMSKERMEFSSWRNELVVRQENGEKSLTALSAEMRDTRAQLSERINEKLRSPHDQGYSTAHTLEEPSSVIPHMSTQLKEISGKQEAELNVIRRAIKNLRSCEMKQSSVSISLDNIEESNNHRCVASNENLGSSNLDLSTSVGSPSPSCDYSRSTGSQSARGRISSASASVCATAPSFCGKISESGSVKVQMKQQIRTSASMNVLPICSADHWRNRVGSANSVVEGGRERTRWVDGTALGTNDKRGRSLVSTSPFQTQSHRHHVPSSSFSPAGFCSPSTNSTLSPESPEYRAVRQSSRLKEW